MEVGLRLPQDWQTLRDIRANCVTGAGNIGPDVNAYADGGIVRKGVQGESEDGEFSTGRGGAGNIGKSPLLSPQSDTGRRSTDVIPEINHREAQEDFHTGVCWHRRITGEYKANENIAGWSGKCP